MPDDEQAGEPQRVAARTGSRGLQRRSSMRQSAAGERLGDLVADHVVHLLVVPQEDVVRAAARAVQRDVEHALHVRARPRAHHADARCRA